MPIFEYQCEKCQERFEELIMGGRDDDVECPSCGSDKARKLVSAFSWSGGEGGGGSSSDCGSCSSSGSACASCSSK